MRRRQRSEAGARRGTVPAVLARILALACLAAGLLFSAAAPALRSDHDKPINIVADNAEADNAKQITIYKGNVVITQGSIRITGDTVTAYYDKDYKLTKLVSEGRPATFRQLPDGSKEYRTAHARRMEYYAQKNLVFLIGNAVYDKGASRVAADRIEYNSLTARAKAITERPKREMAGATGPKKQGERVRITIIPDKTQGQAPAGHKPVSP